MSLSALKHIILLFIGWREVMGNSRHYVKMNEYDQNL